MSCNFLLFLSLVLRYEIKEQQESSIRLDPPATKPSVQQPTPTGGSVSEKGSVGLSEFKPVYLSNSSQPCQCSACVGAVAATIQPVCHMIAIREFVC